MDLAGRTLLGKYRIEGLIGQGGMGTVWKGAHVVTGRKVAIKLLDERFLSNVNVVQRFGREARAASAVQHEGIVEVLDLDQTEEGLPFLVMEFLEGQTLSKRIDSKVRLSQDETVRIVTLLLEALQAAHDGGVVHRDMKPDNIYLVPGRRGEVVKILDFGISHKDDEAAAKLTMTGSVLGTPHYMSPEQAMGETNLDRRVDIYGVGVVLYECLVGDVPFDAPNYNKLLRVILDDEPAPPRKRGAVIDARLEALVLATLAKDRNDRPQTANELLERLRASVSDETEKFGPDVAARLRDASAASAQKRTASQNFSRPERPPATGTPTPTPASGVRGRADAAQLAAAVGAEVGPTRARPAAGTDHRVPLRGTPPAGGLLDAPALGAPALGAPALGPVGALAPAAPPSPATTTQRQKALKLDQPSGGGGLGAFDDLEGGKPVALEIDESALARPSSPPQPHSSTARSSSGMHRALEQPAPRTTPGAGIPMRDRSASRSYDGLPAMRAPAPIDEPPKKAGLYAWWLERPEAVRRWVPVGLAGIIAFVIVVAIVRHVVRPAAALPTTPVASLPTEPGAHGPEWVLVEVDGLPPGAVLRLDGLPGATLPLRVRRGAAHVLEIHAAGYQDRRLEFRAADNLRLRADMRPEIGTGQHR